MASSDSTCSNPSCVSRAVALGLCGGHFYDLARSDSRYPLTRPKRRPEGMSIAEIVEYEILHSVADGGCLRATGRKCKGYAIVGITGKARRLHRIVLEFSVGRSLLPEEYATHNCHVPHCINPLHLRVGSPQDNVDDKFTAGRAVVPRGDSHWNSKLSTEEVLEIRRRGDAGESYGSLSRAFGISGKMAGNIVKRTSWAHLTDPFVASLPSSPPPSERA